MRAALVLVLLGACGYLAGIYRTGWLIAVFAFGAVYVLGLAVWAFLLSRRMRPAEHERDERWELGRRYEVPLIVRNFLSLPCVRFVLTAEGENDWDEGGFEDLEEAQKKTRKKDRKADGERLKKREAFRMEGRADAGGTGTVCLSAPATHCGRVRFLIRSLRTWDGAGVFSFARKYGIVSVTAAVYPPVIPANVSSGFSPTGEEEKVRGDELGRGPGEDEFKSVREYRQGDRLRRIHWKRSAGREELLVRETEGGEERGFRLVFDTTGFSSFSLEERDRFYAFAASAAAGFAAAGKKTDGVFYTAAGEQDVNPLAQSEDVFALLFRMYALGVADTLPEEALARNDDVFVMNRLGEIRCRGNVVLVIEKPELPAVG